MTEKKDGGLGGILKGFTELVEKLGSLMESSSVEKSNEFEWKEKGIKGVYGFSIKTALGGEGSKIEPFGNIHRDRKTGAAVVHEVIEPLVDIMEEERYTVIVAEMPGIGVEDVRLEVKDDVLSITAERDKRKYHKEVLLPACYLREKMEISCNNGIVEIRCRS